MLYSIVGGAIVFAAVSAGFAFLVMRRQRRHNAYLRSQGLAGAIGGNFFSTSDSDNGKPAKSASTIDNRMSSQNYEDHFNNGQAEDVVENPGEQDITQEFGRNRAQTADGSVNLAAARSKTVSIVDNQNKRHLSIPTDFASVTMFEPTLMNTQAGRNDEESTLD